MPFYSEQKPGRAVIALGGSSKIMRLTSVLVGVLFFAMLHTSVQASAPLQATYSLTLAWNPSTSSDVAGYHAYYGTSSGNYTSSILLDNVTTVTIPALSFGVTYYFAITAVDADGLESDFSNEISYQQALTQPSVPATLLQIQGGSYGRFMLTVTGPVGHTYDIEATEDFTTWTVICTTTLDASGSLDFTDTDAPNHSQRFYRTRDTQP